MEPKLLIIGGTGSLGNKLVERYISTHQVYVFSRDENKHWKMQLTYQRANLHFIVGDIRDASRVSDVINQVRPNIIVIAAALKHIERCEFEVQETLRTNLIGCLNVLDCLKVKNNPNLEAVVFISTDKACFPINTYGMTKALAEKAIIEFAKKYPVELGFPKVVNVRYGNVLNSRGSIIEALHHVGTDPSKEFFCLTHPEMTRFIMTQDEAVDLIQYAIARGFSGDTVIPKLSSLKVQDLIEIFSSLYHKSIQITGLRPGEKLSEVLIHQSELGRTIESSKYFIIRPIFSVLNEQATFMQAYNSSEIDLILPKESLQAYLENLQLI